MSSWPGLDARFRNPRTSAARPTLARVAALVVSPVSKSTVPATTRKKTQNRRAGRSSKKRLRLALFSDSSKLSRSLTLSSGSEAVCGPVGDCNAVQDSEYAELLGVPIGVLGVLGYSVLLAGWIISRLVHGRMADWALVFVALGAFGGTLFSAYLTFLEPFVIGATCMWCITSALVMLGLLWLTAARGWAALRRLRAD